MHQFTPILASLLVFSSSFVQAEDNKPLVDSSSSTVPIDGKSSNNQINAAKQRTTSSSESYKESPDRSKNLKKPPSPQAEGSKRATISASESSNEVIVNSPQELNERSNEKTKANQTTHQNSLDPFTGKITKNKVRLRLQPNFEGTPLRELYHDQLLVVVGEADDFYSVRPLPDMKAYIFRTYVLDNVVEGTHVNVRLKPETDAPVIAQLNSGDRVEGHIYGGNNKWLEIAIPAATKFYIAKEYVEKVGDVNYITRMEKKRDDVYRLLNTTKAVSDAEMQKPYNQVNLDGIINNYQRIILDYKDFPEAGAKAQAYLADLQDTYTKKKIEFLEQQSQQSAHLLEQKNRRLAEELQAHKNKLSHLELQMQQNNVMSPEPVAVPKRPTQVPYTMALWIPVEDAIIADWSRQSGNNNPADFYRDQMEKSFMLKGIVDSYNRPVKNKPGDFMLLNGATRLPFAFLYSTNVNLQDFVGHEVTIRVTSRPNSNYAFPAYFVLSIE